MRNKKVGFKVGAVAMAVSSASLLMGVATIATASAKTVSLKTPAGISKADCAKDRAAGTINTVSGFGFGPGPGIVDLFNGVDLGYYTQMCLSINIITSSPNPASIVSAGTAQFSTLSSASAVMQDGVNGANIIGLATLGDTTPYTLMTNPNITNLKQLNGKVVGYHTAMPPVLTEMLVKAGVDVKSLQEVNDTSTNPDLLSQGKFDALQGQINNEPLTLKAEGIPVTQWLPGKFGIKATYTIIYGNRTWVKAHPVATKNYLRVVLHTLSYCHTHAEVCIRNEAAAAAAAGSSFALVHNIAQFKAAINAQYKASLPGKGYGVESYAEWRPEANTLAAFGLLPSVPDVKQWEDPDVVASLYVGTKLLWPATATK